MDLTHINILPLYCQNRLFYIFSNVEYWTITFINTFGNSVFLLEDKKLYNIASRILLNISKYRKDEFEEFYYAMSSIINAFTQLIFINPNLALKLEKKINKIDIPRPVEYLNIRINFLHELLQYKLGNKRSKDRLLSMISSLKILGLEDLSQDFNELYQTIVTY